MAGEAPDDDQPDAPDEEAEDHGASNGSDGDAAVNDQPDTTEDDQSVSAATPDEDRDDDADAGGSDADSSSLPEEGSTDPESPDRRRGTAASGDEPADSGIEGSADDVTDGDSESDASDNDGNEGEGEQPTVDDSWKSWFYGEEGPPEQIGTEDEDEPAGDSDPGQESMGVDTPEDDTQEESFEPPRLTPEEPAAAPIASGRRAPDSDREMPLTDHVEEMLKRLAVVIAIAGVVSLVTFPFAEHLINVFWYGILPGTDVARPRVYGILSLKLTELKVASLAGVIVALPVLVYETYQFMRPGLYPHERRYYLAAIPTSLILALVGVSFAFFIVLPAIFIYFLHYSETVATIGFGLMRTFDLILLLMGYLAVVFQIPLFLMLAMMMGIVTRQWLVDRRLLFWGAFLGISFLFSPDPTGMAPIIVALTMIVLFEGTLLITRWTGR